MTATAAKRPVGRAARWEKNRSFRHRVDPGGVDRRRREAGIGQLGADDHLQRHAGATGLGREEDLAGQAGPVDQRRLHLGHLLRAHLVAGASHVRPDRRSRVGRVGAVGRHCDPQPRSHRQGSGPLDEPLEARPQRLRHHLRRPSLHRQQLNLASLSCTVLLTDPASGRWIQVQVTVSSATIPWAKCGGPPPCVAWMTQVSGAISIGWWRRGAHTRRREPRVGRRGCRRVRAPSAAGAHRRRPGISRPRRPRR